MRILFSIALLAAGIARGEDPFVSVGFLAIPESVKLGAMSAVELDGRGNIYVLHRGEPPLLQFDLQGRFRRGFGEGAFKVAHGLRADKAGNVWTTDNGLHVLRQFSSEGKLLRTLGEEGAASGDERHFKAPDDVVFASNGDMYVADSGNGRIVRLNRNGQYLGQWGTRGKQTGEFATAHGLAIDKRDRVYVADRGNERIQVFDSTGKFLAEWKGFGNPFGLLVMDGQLLASEGDKNRIYHFDLESGRIVSDWGGEGILALPHLMATDSSGRLYVAEVNGKRVQIFRRNR